MFDKYHENIKPIQDLIKFCPDVLLNPKHSNVTWTNTPYGNFVLQLTGGSTLYHHVNIIFKGDGRIKFYFFKPSTVCNLSSEYNCTNEVEAATVKSAILNILKKTGKFDLEG